MTTSASVSQWSGLWIAVRVQSRPVRYRRRDIIRYLVMNPSELMQKGKSKDHESAKLKRRIYW